MSAQASKGQQALKERVAAESAEKQGPTPFQQLSHALEARRAHFKQLLGTDEAASRFIRVVLTAAQHNPELVTADARTMLVACMKAAMDGLMPDGREAVLNIYNTKIGPKGHETWIKAVQYLPMIGGLLKKLWESGLFVMLDGVVVYERDSFKYQRGDEPKIEHIPYDGPEDPGEIKAAYFIAKLKNGEVKREVMWRRDIEKVRLASKAPEGLMWSTFYDQGAIKSVIKRAYKQLPSTPAMEQLIRHDNEAMGFTPMSTLDILPFQSQQPALPEQAGGTTIEGMNSMPASAEKDKAPANGNGSAPEQKRRTPEVSSRAAPAAEPKPETPSAKTATPEPELVDEVVAIAIGAKNTEELDQARDLARGLQTEEERTLADEAIFEAEQRLGLRKPE